MHFICEDIIHRIMSIIILKHREWDEDLMGWLNLCPKAMRQESESFGRPVKR